MTVIVTASAKTMKPPRKRKGSKGWTTIRIRLETETELKAMRKAGEPLNNVIEHLLQQAKHPTKHS